MRRKNSIGLKDYVAKTCEIQEEIVREFPDVDLGLLHSPFWERPFLGEDFVKLIVFAEAAGKAEFLQSMADVAYGCFVRWFLSEAVRALPLDIHSRAVADPDRVEELVQELRTASKEDPFAQWLVNEAPALLCKLRSSARVRTIEDLARLVCHYDYYYRLYQISGSTAEGGEEEQESKQGVLAMILEDLAEHWA